LLLQDALGAIHFGNQVQKRGHLLARSFEQGVKGIVGRSASRKHKEHNGHADE
jgi:hypothetical protein